MIDTVRCVWCRAWVPIAEMEEHRRQELLDAALVLTEIPAGLQPAGVAHGNWENDQ